MVNKTSRGRKEKPFEMVAIELGHRDLLRVAEPREVSQGGAGRPERCGVPVEDHRPLARLEIHVGGPVIVVGEIAAERSQPLERAGLDPGESRRGGPTKSIVDLIRGVSRWTSSLSAVIAAAARTTLSRFCFHSWAMRRSPSMGMYSQTTRIDLIGLTPSRRMPKYLGVRNSSNFRLERKVCNSSKKGDLRAPDFAKIRIGSP